MSKWNSKLIFSLSAITLSLATPVFAADDEEVISRDKISSEKVQKGFISTNDEQYDKKRKKLIEINKKSQEGSSLGSEKTIQKLIKNVAVHPSLKKHSEALPYDFSEIKDLDGHNTGIWVSQGRGLANSILVKGQKDKYLVIDTMESAEAADAVKKDFDTVLGTDGEIEGIVITHFHKDHVQGTDLFDPEHKAKVYGTKLTHEAMDAHGNPAENLITVRSLLAYGNFSPVETQVNAGIGRKLNVGRHSKFHPRLPDVTFQGEQEFVIAGEKVILSQAPGETPDQLYAYIPNKKALFPGDNFYEAFPNLYTLRGTPYRDPLCWIETLQKLIDLVQKEDIQILVPSHTRPIVGKSKIIEALQCYHDGIKFTYDQTIRLMHKGLRPNEIALKLKLPPQLENAPCLQQNYGTVEDAARMIYLQGLIGFFDTNPSNIFPLDEELFAIKCDKAGSNLEKANRYYVKALRTNNRELMTVASKFCDMALKVAESKLRKAGADLQIYTQRQPVNQDLILQKRQAFLEKKAEMDKAMLLKIQATIGVASHCTSAMGYSFCTTTIPVITGAFRPAETLIGLFDKDQIRKYGHEKILNGLARELDPAKTISGVVNFRFEPTRTPLDDEDTGEYSLVVRNAVAINHRFNHDNPDFTVKGNPDVWKEVAVGLTNLDDALQQRNLMVEGDIEKLKQFLEQFDMPLKR